MAVGFGSDPFEQFKRNRKIQGFEEQLKSRVVETRQEIVRKIAAADQAEEIEQKIAQEMREFFRESTRLAASALALIQKERVDQVEMRLEMEIAGFFEETKARALVVLEKLKQGDPSAPAAFDELLQERVRSSVARAAASAPK
ncbi:MAG TPA: hypothetical protein VKE69_00880 [Planctomycetota bacterium]|nr:hypothetical protein [Planctomycetota bacterium]